MGRSTKFYQENPSARKRKAKTDKKINSRPSQVKKRVESNRKRREAKKKGKDIRGLDWDHATRRFTSIKANRGRKGEGNRGGKSL